MTVKNSPEERLLMKMLEKLPLEPSEKQTWTNRIRAEGFSEELAEEIHQKLSAAKPDGRGDGQLARLNLEYAQAVKRWRLARQATHFHR